MIEQHQQILDMVEQSADMAKLYAAGFGTYVICAALGNNGYLWDGGVIRKKGTSLTAVVPESFLDTLRSMVDGMMGDDPENIPADAIMCILEDIDAKGITYPEGMNEITARSLLRSWIESAVHRERGQRQTASPSARARSNWQSSDQSARQTKCGIRASPGLQLRGQLIRGSRNTGRRSRDGRSGRSSSRACQRQSVGALFFVFRSVLTKARNATTRCGFGACDMQIREDYEAAVFLTFWFVLAASALWWLLLKYL